MSGVNAELNARLRKSDYGPAAKAWAGLVAGAVVYAAVADALLYVRGLPFLSTAFRAASRGPASGPLLGAAWFGGFATLTIHFYKGKVLTK